jgi:hypothetical protein
MKFATLALLSTLSNSTAFVPSRPIAKTLALHSTLESPPERIAPSAGSEPAWENRPGLTPEEFMSSDMSKPDLGGMWECPLTRWDSDNINVAEAQRLAKKAPGCPFEIRANPADNEMGAAYFAKNKDMIRKQLLKHGAIWFRGFDLMKSVSGNRDMHEALGLDPCLDPLHSSGLRKFASERDALYEEVSHTLYLIPCDCSLWQFIIKLLEINVLSAIFNLPSSDSFFV